jgi:hypothetical protein
MNDAVERDDTTGHAVMCTLVPMFVPSMFAVRMCDGQA